MSRDLVLSIVMDIVCQSMDDVRDRQLENENRHSVICMISTHLIRVVEVENVISNVLQYQYRTNRPNPFQYRPVLSINQYDNLVAVVNLRWPHFQFDRASSSPHNESFRHRIVSFSEYPDSGRDRQTLVYSDCPTNMQTNDELCNGQEDRVVFARYISNINIVD